MDNQSVVGKSMQHLRQQGVVVTLLILLSFWLLASKAMFNAPLAVLALMGIVVLVRHRELRQDPGWRLFLLAWLCIWLPQVASLPDAVNMGRSLNTTLGFLKFPLAGAAIIWALRCRSGTERTVMLGVTLVFGLYAADMLWQLATGRDWLGFQGTGDGRLTGPSSDDKLAIAMGAFFPLALESIVRSRGYRWLFAAIVLLMVVAILLSGQRGGMLAMLVGGGVWALFYLRHRAGRACKRVALIATVIVLMAIPWGLDALQQLPGRHAQTAMMFNGDGKSINNALAGRIGLWRASSFLFLENPVNGIGPRGFRYVLADKGEAYALTEFGGRKPYIATHPHQQFLEIAAETGMIGVAGYLMALILLIRRLFKGAKDSRLAWSAAALSAVFPLNMSMAFYGTYWSHVVLLAIVFAFSISGVGIDERGRSL